MRTYSVQALSEVIQLNRHSGGTYHHWPSEMGLETSGNLPRGTQLADGRIAVQHSAPPCRYVFTCSLCLSHCESTGYTPRVLYLSVPNP